MTISSGEIVADLHELSDQLDLDLEEVEVSGASSLENDLGMDSLNLMDFLVFLEKKYRVKISDEHLNDVETISDIVHVLNEISPAAAGPTGDAAA
ncbi:acyl carrier protein [Streptomyces hainanensis]|uniref:Acyl carrier protein n=1 Tax=Streptomyces hainanensis TaxID=402648 RepID=A0A4R4TEW4_9ACTN|nr:acyl carrier protein [Streptomyces hainanensis]TDC74144.1 acyl carrier protein [Streptomyces hainanensis]